VYLEHAVIEREANSVAAFMQDGRVSLPAASLSVLMLGPGTRITSSAVAVLADHGATIVWTGEDGFRFYAAGSGKTRSSAVLHRQVAAHAEPTQRLAVVRRMYEIRFGERLDPELTLPQIRGREGARVRDAYQEAARKYGVAWGGRSFRSDDWNSADPLNRALSSCNAALYAICTAGCVANGVSPALGFIHSGKQLSFVYDLADLFKTQLTVPAAFEAAAGGDATVERRARTRFRELAHEQRLVDQLQGAITKLFPDLPTKDGAEFDENPALPGSLWDPKGDVSGGRSW